MRRRLAATGRWLLRRAGWTVLALAAVALLLGCVLVFPRLLYPPLSDREFDQAGIAGKDRIQLQSERLKLQNDVRTALVQGLGGAVLLLGAWFTYRQLHTGREGQITERFTRAVDQLGSNQLDVRLGGIFALERIAGDSVGDRRAIAEILTVYIRQRSPWPPAQPNQLPAGAPLDQQPDLRTRAPDVQAALTVLGRGPFPKPGITQGEHERLDLHSTDLRKAHLFGGHLEGALLDNVHLEGAVLFDAHLEGAVLDGAHLEEAYLDGAHLEGPFLRGAHLKGAVLLDAHLEGAVLNSAHLKGVKANEATRWPARFDPKAVGVVLVDMRGRRSRARGYDLPTG
jgi:hypothetical protein